MKKIMIGVLGLILISLYATGVMAIVTIVSGKVTWQDKVTPIDGAQVDVNCYFHNSSTPTHKNTTSLYDGTYAVYFLEMNQCDDGDTVYVTATKDGATGSNSGVVHNNLVGPIDIAIVNVSIPEFTAITAGIALTGALLGLSIFRKHRRG